MSGRLPGSDSSYSLIFPDNLPVIQTRFHLPYSSGGAAVFTTLFLLTIKKQHLTSNIKFLKTIYYIIIKYMT